MMANKHYNCTKTLEKREKNIAPGTSGSNQAQIAEVGLSPQTVSNIMNIVNKFLQCGKGWLEEMNSFYP